METAKHSFKLLRKPNLGPPVSRIGMASIVFICVLGLAAAATVGYSAHETYKQSSIERTKSIAEALPTSELSKLANDEVIRSENKYEEIRERLQRIKQSNNDIRTIYITVMRDNQIFYIADSENKDEPDAAQTGDIYHNPTIGHYQSFQSQRTYFGGPWSDKTGTWMTSAAPIYDQEKGVFIALLSIDSPAAHYTYDLGIRMLVPIFIALTASILLWKIDHVRRKHEEITQLKNQFVSIASHELRSPLSGMLWAIQTLLNDKDTTEAQSRILEDMHKSTASSIATVNEILDLSVFERDKVGKIQKVDMDLNAATREVIKNLKLGASEKHIDLHLAHLAHLAPVHGDPGAIKRSIMNVVSNAIKYSPEGSTIKIHYGYTDKLHRISVKDQGIGIPKKDQKKVLNGYYRSKNAVKVQSTGTGLGLYVSKLIIEEHGGKMELVSEEGSGTEITMSLPRLPEKESKETIAKDESNGPDASPHQPLHPE